MTKCLFCTIRPRCPRFAPAVSDSPPVPWMPFSGDSPPPYPEYLPAPLALGQTRGFVMNRPRPGARSKTSRQSNSGYLTCVLYIS